MSLCCVCWDELSPTVRAPLSCEQNHILCDGCLSAHVRERASPPQRLIASGCGIPCAAFGCSSHPWALEDLADRLDRDATVAFGVALRRIFVDAPAAVAAAAAAMAKRDAEARTLAIPARAREIVRIIAERDLWLRCPRCSAKYLDYSGCCALTCSANGCHFCGICLTLHPTDAATHEHFREVHGGDIFDAARVQKAHAVRRTGLLVTAVRSYAADGRDLQRAVIHELAREELVPGFSVDAAHLTSSAGVEAVGAEPGDPVALAAAAAAASLGVKLHTAITDNCVFEAVRLVSDGADLTIFDASGKGALLRALEKPLPDVVQAIVSAASKSAVAVDKAGGTPLHIAARHGFRSAIALLLDKGVNVDAVDRNRSTALHAAVSSGQEGAVRQLLAAGARATIRDKSGRTPLHSALVLRKEAEAIAIIAAKPDLSLLDNEGASALLLACREGLSAAALAMLTTPSRLALNLSDAHGDTALHWASVNCTLSVVEALLEGKATVNALNKSGFGPLGMACKNRREDCVLLLLAAGSDIDRASPLPLLAMPEVRDMPAVGAAISRKKGLGAGLLAAICAGRSLHALRLIRDRARFVVTNEYGTRRSALLLSCKHALEEVALAILGAPHQVADVNEEDKLGMTPLSWASKCGLSAVVGALLARGASIDSIDRTQFTRGNLKTHGTTALWHACTHGHEEVALGLLAAGASVLLGRSCTLACGDRLPKVKAALQAKGCK